jgi:glycogen operon protein
MAEDDWSSLGPSVAVFLNGNGIPDRDARGERVVDDSFLMCFNAHHEPVDFILPPSEYAESWETVIDTTEPQPAEKATLSDACARLTIEARSLVVLLKVG